MTEKKYQQLVNEYVELLSLKKYNMYSQDLSIFYKTQRKLSEQLVKIKRAYRMDISLAASSALPLEEDVETLRENKNRIQELIIKVNDDELLTVDDFKDTYYWSGVLMMIRFTFLFAIVMGLLVMVS